MKSLQTWIAEAIESSAAAKTIANQAYEYLQAHAYPGQEIRGKTTLHQSAQNFLDMEAREAANSGKTLLTGTEAAWNPQPLEDLCSRHDHVYAKVILLESKVKSAWKQMSAEEKEKIRPTLQIPKDQAYNYRFLEEMTAHVPKTVQDLPAGTMLHSGCSCCYQRVDMPAEQVRQWKQSGYSEVEVARQKDGPWVKLVEAGPECADSNAWHNPRTGEYQPGAHERPIGYVGLCWDKFEVIEERLEMPLVPSLSREAKSAAHAIA